MSDENLHWSERAKLGNPSGLPPVFVPPQPPPRKSNRKYGFVGIGLFLVAVIAVAVVVFFDPLGGDSSASVTSVANTEAGLATTTSMAKLPTKSSSLATGALTAADTVYASTALGFTVQCPEGWESFSGYSIGPYMDADESFGLRDPAGAIGNVPSPNYLVLTAFKNDGTLTESLDDALQGLAERWVAELPRYFEAALTGHATAISVNGMEGAEVALTYEVEDLPLTMRLSMLESPTVGFMFIFNAYQEDWQTYEPVFDSALNSLTVTSTG